MATAISNLFKRIYSNEWISTILHTEEENMYFALLFHYIYIPQSTCSWFNRRCSFEWKLCLLRNAIIAIHTREWRKNMFAKDKECAAAECWLFHEMLLYGSHLSVVLFMNRIQYIYSVNGTTRNDNGQWLLLFLQNLKIECSCFYSVELVP